MRVSAEFAEWLNDRDRCAASARRAAEVVETWVTLPWVVRLREALSLLPVDPASDDVLDLAAPYLRDTAPIDAAVRAFAAAADDPFSHPPFYALITDVARGLVLLDHRLLTVSTTFTRIETLAAKKAQPGPRSIPFNGRGSHFRFLRAGGATVSFWEAPADAGPGSRCTLADRRRIEDGEEIRLAPVRQTFVIEHACGDIVSVQAASHAGAAALNIEFDSETHCYAGASSADEGSSRIEMMASLLRVLDRHDAAPLLGELMRDSPHFTRWALMREMLAMDADAALPFLRALAASDPHAEVREVANQTIAAFFADDDREEAA